MTGRTQLRPEVELAPGTVFLGDLHIDLEEPAQLAAFEATLESLAGAPRLVFVGDVFEYWFGPAQADGPGGHRAMGALRRLVEQGTAVELVPGNRDFLLDSRFEAASGVRLRPVGLVGVLPDGERLLVIHGDELCTLDTGYLRLRAVLRSRAVRWLAPRLPASWGRAVARRLRRASRRALATKPNARAQQQHAAVRELCREAACGALLCGHAHRFRDTLLEDGPRWIVLDAWGDERDLVTVGAAGELVARASGSAAGPATF